jgi:hypothetical protein
MSKIIKCVMLANGDPGPAGQYLASYDQETGESVWTLDKDMAKPFPGALEAIEFWRQVLPSQPVRPWDGKPNRPLTAFTIEIEEGA